MKKVILITILLTLFLFGCTESNYIDLAKMDRSFNVIEGINVPSFSFPGIMPNDFVFPSAVHVFSDDSNMILNLFMLDTNFGDQWLSVNKNKKELTFCNDLNKCETKTFIATNCYKGMQAGENQNWYYCKEIFYRKYIDSEGFIRPEEILDVNFYIDSRKISAKPISQEQKIGIDNIVSKDAFGISGVKREYLEDLIKKQEEMFKQKK